MKWTKNRHQMKLKNILNDKNNFYFLIIFFFYTINSIIFRNTFPVPTTDIFEYIKEGNYYINFRLPEAIHSAPLLPFIISFISQFTKYFSLYPEFSSAHLINISASSLTLLFIFLIIKKYSSKLSLIISILVASNYYFSARAIDVTTEVLYGLGITLVIYFYQKKNYYLTSIFCVLALLTRYEAIILPISIAFIEILTKSKNIKIKHVISYLIPVFIWFFILFLNSKGNILSSNLYLNDLINLKNSNNLIQHIYPFTKSLELVLYDSYIHRLELPIILFIIEIVFSLYIFKLIFKNITDNKHDNTTKLAYIIFLFNTSLVCIFPYFNIRYIVPTVWILYLLLINKKDDLLKYILIFIFICINISNFNKESDFRDKKKQIGYIYAADWINNNNFEKNTIVLVFEPYILRYFITNPNVTIYPTYPNLFDQCNNQLNCVAKKINPKYKNIYIVTTLHTTSKISETSDKHSLNINKISAFQNYPNNEEKKDIQLIKKIEIEDKWTKIYKYSPILNQP